MAKPKKVHVMLISPDGPQPKGDPYKILKRLVAGHHRHLAQAKIALAWHKGWKADPDGVVKLGKAKKASDLDREFHDHDFVIVLNFNVWDRIDFTEKQIEALLDHELCHCQVALDEDGEPKEDERGRTVWRVRKHDLEEFREVVQRHGCWKSDLEMFVKAALRRQPSLFADVPPAQDPSEVLPYFLKGTRVQIIDPNCEDMGMTGIVMAADNEDTHLRLVRLDGSSEPAWYHVGQLQLDPAEGAKAALANDPKLLKAAEGLCPDGKGFTALELSIPGEPGKTAVLTSETRKRIRERRKAIEAGGG